MSALALFFGFKSVELHQDQLVADAFAFILTFGCLDRKASIHSDVTSPAPKDPLLLRYIIGTLSKYSSQGSHPCVYLPGHLSTAHPTTAKL